MENKYLAKKQKIIYTDGARIADSCCGFQRPMIYTDKTEILVSIWFFIRHTIYVLGGCLLNIVFNLIGKTIFRINHSVEHPPAEFFGGFFDMKAR